MTRPCQTHRIRVYRDPDDGSEAAGLCLACGTIYARQPGYTDDRLRQIAFRALDDPPRELTDTARRRLEASRRRLDRETRREAAR